MAAAITMSASSQPSPENPGFSTTDAVAGSAPLVVMQNICKSYSGLRANDAIDLTLEAGQIHALLGENGAGKSTLVKVLYGLLTPDAGSITWQGKPVTMGKPGVARDLGIAMVFQHFSLFDSLSVVENIALGLDVDADDVLRQKIQDVSRRYGLALDPDRSVYTLSVGARQRIEIVRCLLQDPSLLIMDEPTSVLTPQEVEELFVTLKALAAEGMAILYISHKLEEIRTLCQTATVLRGGRKVAQTDPKNESVASLAALMMGEQLPAEVALSKAGAGSVEGEIADAQMLVLDALDAPADTINGVSLQQLELCVSAGEIVGIAGVAGNGQDELLRVLAGEIKSADANQILFDGTAIGAHDAGHRRRLGMCCVPEERLGHAAVPSLSLSENVFLTAHHRKPFVLGGLIRHKRSRTFAQQVIDTFNVQCDGPHALASSLSGGNLQKFIVGREILQQPRVLVVSQPTWGVDAGAAAAIHSALAALAREGAAVLIISQDLDELMRCTHRIGAIFAGRLSAFHQTREVTVQQVGLLMGGEAINGRTAIITQDTHAS